MSMMSDGSDWRTKERNRKLSKVGNSSDWKAKHWILWFVCFLVFNSALLYLGAHFNLSVSDAEYDASIGRSGDSF
jgi:hypothetical protein